MKTTLAIATTLTLAIVACNPQKENANTLAEETAGEKQLYIDVHDLDKVAFNDVAEAHKKDLATQDKYGVKFIKYWVDEEAGKVYCLSEASHPEMIRKTHHDAHGLAPAKIHLVSDGKEASMTGKQLFIDIHRVGPGEVTALAVADAHEKDLAVQDKYGVNFINYWVDEKEGMIMCLSEAPDSSAIIHTHKEAHGMGPDEILKVKQGE